MSNEAGVAVVIDELVLDGVDSDMVPVLMHAIEDALARSPVVHADDVADIVSSAVARALQPKADR